AGGLAGPRAAGRAPPHRGRPRLARERLVVGQLDALEAAVVTPDEPEHVGRQLAARVEPEGLRYGADPREPLRPDGLGRCRRNLQLHPDQGALTGQTLLDVPRTVAEVRG